MQQCGPGRSRPGGESVLRRAQLSSVSALARSRPAVSVRSPAVSSRLLNAEPAVVLARERVRTRATQTVEASRPSASIANGRAGWMPNSAPPTSGPTSRAVWVRAWSRAVAVPIWSAGTTARIRPKTAGA
ncbi:hypothetical protein SMICM304S_01267 [Streptomyces microflavus]